MPVMSTRWNDRSGRVTAGALQPARRQVRPLVEDHVAADGLEAEGHLEKPAERRGDTRMRLGLGEEQEEAASAGADELAARAAAPPRPLVELVDIGRGDPAGEAPLELPALVQQLAAVAEAVRAFQDVDRL